MYVSISLILNPFPLSYEDLEYIETLYTNNHINADLMSEWFGSSCNFICSPVINGSVKNALYEFEIITVEIKKLLREKAPAPVSDDNKRQIAKLCPKRAWPKTHDFWTPITKDYDIPNGDRPSISMDINSLLIFVGQLRHDGSVKLKTRVKSLLSKAPPNTRATVMIGIIYMLWMNDDRDTIWYNLNHFEYYKLPPNEYRAYAKRIDTVIKSMAVSPLGERLNIAQLSNIINTGHFGGRVDQKSDVYTEIENRNVYPQSILSLETLDPTTGEWSQYGYIKHFTETWTQVVRDALEYLRDGKALTVRDYVVKLNQTISSGQAAGFTKNVKVREGLETTIRLQKRAMAEEFDLGTLLRDAPSWLRTELSRKVDKYETSKPRALFPSNVTNVAVVDLLFAEIEKALMRVPDYRGKLRGLARLSKIFSIMRQMVAKTSNSMDYTDYNRQHLCVLMAAVYHAIGHAVMEVKQVKKGDDYAELLHLGIHLAANMSVTYPETDPLTWKVFQGLFSGLRFTGMTNTSQNMTDARIVSQMMTQLFNFPGEEPTERECMGDDIDRKSVV